MENGLLVLDFGGTAIKYGVWVAEDLKEQGQVPTPKKLADFLQTVAAIKTKLSSRYQLNGCACSAPGAIDQNERRIYGNSAIHFLNQVDFFQQLEEALELPVTIENDANCAALAEVASGAAAGKSEVLVLAIGSGIGGAIIQNGQLQPGHHLFGGEFGFMLLEGQHNFSQLATPVAMAKRVSLAKGLAEDGLSGKEVFELAENGDEIAVQAVESFYYYLAVGLYNLQTSVDPEIILLGGGISARNDLLEKIEEQFDYIFERGQRLALRPQIARCKYQNDANLIGAVANFKRINGSN